MEISSLCSYVEQICQINEPFKKSRLPTPTELLFRGHSDKKFTLLPSLARGRRSPGDCTIFNNERNLIEMAKNKFPDIFRDTMQPVELLALLQHHGIPTRMLDVTENALVALYFACANSEADGEVFVFINKDNHVDNAPVISAVAETYKLTRGAKYTLKNFYRAALNQSYFTEQRHIFEICKETINGAEWIEKCCSETIFVHAPIHTLRQQIQQGRYILFPNRIIDSFLGTDDKAFETIIDPLPKDHKCIKHRFIIKKECKQEILKDLEICGISEPTLFCDSIDRVCNGIVKKMRKML